LSLQHFFFKEQTRSPTDVCVDEEIIQESTWRKNAKTRNVIWMSSVQHTRQRLLQNRWKSHINLTTLTKVVDLRNSKLKVSVWNDKDFKDFKDQDFLRYLTAKHQVSSTGISLNRIRRVWLWSQIGNSKWSEWYNNLNWYRLGRHKATYIR